MPHESFKAKARQWQQIIQWKHHTIDIEPRKASSDSMIICGQKNVFQKNTGKNLKSPKKRECPQWCALLASVKSVRLACMAKQNRLCVLMAGQRAGREEEEEDL